MCKILGAQHSFKRRSQKTRPTSVRDIGDKAPFDKAPLGIRRQKKKCHVIDKKKKGRKMEKIRLMALEPKLVATSLKMHLNNNIWEKEKGAG
jgi:hypothetical protein